MRKDHKNQRGKNLLDKVRIEKGIDKMRALYRELVEQKAEEVIDLLNRDDLQFPSLFVLLNDIEKLTILDRLNERDQVAIEIVKDILSRNARTPAAPYRFPICDHVQMVHSVLRWIVETGSKEAGLGVDYSQTLDSTVALLIRDFGDKTILYLVADLIFMRLENEMDYLNLVWSFFESRDPYSMVLIADHLRSAGKKERELAKRLLGFVLKDLNKETERESQYWAFHKWLEENGPYLYYQGETFDMTSTPSPYIVVLEGKYLGRSVSVNSGKIQGLLTEDEDRLLKEFKKVEEDVKIRLATYSSVLRNQSLQYWQAWLHIPMTEKLKIANLRRVQ